MASMGLCPCPFHNEIVQEFYYGYGLHQVKLQAKQVVTVIQADLSSVIFQKKNKTKILRAKLVRTRNSVQVL